MEKYIKVFVKSKADLPDGKGENKYFAHSTISKISLIECSLTDLIWGNGIYDYYLQPISDTELIVPSEGDIEKEAIKISLETAEPPYTENAQYFINGFARGFIYSAKWAIEQIKKFNQK
jgi:hypothetical protein